MRPEIEIVAELAQGYEGILEQALLLLKAAATAKADAAKYQVIYADELCTPDYKHFELFSSLEMSDESWMRIIKEASRHSIRVILDVFGRRSLGLAERIGVREIMVHATDLTNMSFIQSIASSSCTRVMLGVGGAFMSEIRAAVEALKTKEITVMVGFQGYPTPDDDNQISRIRRIQEELAAYSNVVFGFADHSLPDSPWVVSYSSVALGLGARVFEKHLTLGEIMKLEDHEAAINPDRFFLYVKGLRAAASALGCTVPRDDFGMYKSEKRYRNMVRRCVIAAASLDEGVTIRACDVKLMRSGEVGDFASIDDVVGMVVRSPVQMNQPIKREDVQYELPR